MKWFNKWFDETKQILESLDFTQEQIKSFPYWQDSFCYEMTSQDAIIDFYKWLCE